MNDQQRLELEAAAFRRLVAHLDSRKDVQNIDLLKAHDGDAIAAMRAYITPTFA